MTSARIDEIRLILIALLAMMLLGAQPFQRQATAAQNAAQPAAEVSGDIDITGYQIDAEMVPDQNTLRATATVTYRALKASRSVTFKMNGSLRVTAARDAAAKPLQFAQDTLQDFNVKVDLGQVMTVGQSYTLAFDYAGQLVTAEGGPLPDRRLAYVGPEGAYLNYAARWFPFHEYGADRTTMELHLAIPSAWKLAAHSDTPLAPAPGK